MPSVTVQVVVDAASPAALAEFWVLALGYRLEAPPAAFETWEQALVAAGIPPERWDDANAINPVPPAMALACSSRRFLSARR